MRLDRERLKQESERMQNGEYPNYMASSGSIACPFLTAEAAVEWHNFMLSVGVETVITDVRDYDWVNNPAGLVIQNTMTDEIRRALHDQVAANAVVN